MQEAPISESATKVSEAEMSTKTPVFAGEGSVAQAIMGEFESSITRTERRLRTRARKAGHATRMRNKPAKRTNRNRKGAIKR